MSSRLLNKLAAMSNDQRLRSILCGSFDLLNELSKDYLFADQHQNVKFEILGVDAQSYHCR